MTSKFHEIESALEVPDGFFDSLRHEESWSFTIKLHAFLQSLFAMLLASCLQKPELITELAYLPVSDSKFGQVAFALRLGIIDKEIAKFVDELSYHRNKMAR